MIKFIIISILSFNIFALSFEIKWDADFTKRTRINCNFEQRCFKYLGGVRDAPERFCSDCLSTSIKMDFIFKGIGSYIVQGKKYYGIDLFKRLANDQLISMNFETPYNLIDSTSRIKAKRKFRRLCPGTSDDPVLFFERNEYDEIGIPRFILCDGTAYKVDILEVERGGRTIQYFPARR